ncbi:MAG TPA: PrsW family glutamic-type intramembrane protease, partial [Candidatus Thermoplasmatota archaeon]|nr:PrsW family glutamic-type intramembrane protease [Candidatus Thermoplasmatota archaeon]
MSQVEIAVVIGAAFVPALALLLLIQQAERRGHREGLGMLGATFLYGAVFAVVFALVLNPLATGVLSRFLPALDARFVAIVVAAPLVEEAVKAYG